MGRPLRIAYPGAFYHSPPTGMNIGASFSPLKREAMREVSKLFGGISPLNTRRSEQILKKGTKLSEKILQVK